MNTQSHTSRLSSLDGLRAVSIAMVVVSHFFWGKIDIGGIGVDIFFVISGFLITTLLLKEKIKTGTINLKYFYLRRCFRILPLVFLFIASLVCLNYIFNLKIRTISFIASTFFLRNLPIAHSKNWYTGHFWSLAVEEQFYLIFPFILSRLTIKQYKSLILILILLVPILYYLYYDNIGNVLSNHIMHSVVGATCTIFGLPTCNILVGSFLACLLIENNSLFKVKGITKNYFFTTIFFILAILCGLYSPLGYFTPLLFSFLVGYIIINNTMSNNFLSKIFNLKPVVYVGILSYSMYVWQQLFSHFQPWRNAWKYGDSLILNFIVFMLVSILSYELYEKKFLKLKSRFY